MTSSLLCCLTTTGQPETQNISPGGHANSGLGGLGGVGNSYGDDKDDGVELSDFSGNVAVDENDYSQVILITGAGEQEEMWSRLRRRKPTATISDLRLQLLLEPLFHTP